jgi:hypothetical protein
LGREGGNEIWSRREKWKTGWCYGSIVVDVTRKKRARGRINGCETWMP